MRWVPARSVFWSTRGAGRWLGRFLLVYPSGAPLVGTRSASDGPPGVDHASSDSLPPSNVDRPVVAVILANALIRAAVLLGAAFVLDGTDCYSQVSTVLYAGAGASVAIVAVASSGS